jgi:hypothetical protein
VGRLDTRGRLALLGLLLLGATLLGHEAHHAAVAHLEAAQLASLASALLACTTALSLHTHTSQTYTCDSQLAPAVSRA